MGSNNNEGYLVSNLNYAFSKPILHLSIAGLIVCLSNASHAGSLQASYGQLEQQVALQDKSILTKPDGGALSLSFDLDDHWNLSVGYQNLQDNQSIDPTASQSFSGQVNIDLQTWSTAISYYHNAWSFSSQYSVANDDTTIYLGNRLQEFREEALKSTSLSGSVAYGWNNVNWFYNASIAAQYSDWDLRAQQTMPNEVPQGDPREQSSQFVETSGGNSSTVNASLSMARYWFLDQNKGVLVGALVAWNYVLSGESSTTARNGNNIPPPQSNNPRTPHTSSRSPSLSSIGDDNSGQFSLYLSYDISDTWSLDFDIAKGIGSDFNGQSWSIGSSYTF